MAIKPTRNIYLGRKNQEPVPFSRMWGSGSLHPCCCHHKIIEFEQEFHQNSQKQNCFQLLCVGKSYQFIQWYRRMNILSGESWDARDSCSFRQQQAWIRRAKGGRGTCKWAIVIFDSVAITADFGGRNRRIIPSFGSSMTMVALRQVYHRSSFGLIVLVSTVMDVHLCCFC